MFSLKKGMTIWHTGFGSLLECTLEHSEDYEDVMGNGYFLKEKSRFSPEKISLKAQTLDWKPEWEVCLFQMKEQAMFHWKQEAENWVDQTLSTPEKLVSFLLNEYEKKQRNEEFASHHQAEALKKKARTFFDLPKEEKL